jgi:hypothetical protein
MKQKSVERSWHVGAVLFVAGSEKFSAYSQFLLRMLSGVVITI